MNLTRGCFKVISLSRLVALQDCLMGIVPVVPHKGVAEVSRIGNHHTIGEIGCCELAMAEQKH